MKRSIVTGLGTILLCVFIVVCKGSNEASGGSTNYFQTHFQDESQFIVETIVADLAEQIYFAKFHKLPEAKSFLIAAAETKESKVDAPTYEVLVNLDGDHRDFKIKLNVDQAIWSPEIYGDLVKKLAQAVDLPTTNDPTATDAACLAKLSECSVYGIEAENKIVSAKMEKDFCSPALHERAAAMLGAFMMREHSGDFFEIRSPLCRMTAHLAFARFLRGDLFKDDVGQIAGITLLTLMNNQAAAMEALGAVKTSTPALTAWARALAARNTGDYRPMDKLAGLTKLEQAEWFYALGRAASPEIAWDRLNSQQRMDVDFVRIASQENYAVNTGHKLRITALPLELQEIFTAYWLSHGQKMVNMTELVPALNQLPGGCFLKDENGAVHVRVISWGLWAGFLQRQLCHEVQSEFEFLHEKWGVEGESRAFAEKSDGMFAGLRLYPFVRRFNSTDVETYRRSVDDGFKVTVVTPQLVPAECWNYLCYEFSPAEHYQPNPRPHVNEWHKHNPPPGTVYDVSARLAHPSLTRRHDSLTVIEELHRRAPFDGRINDYLEKKKFNGAPNYQQATEIYGGLSAYNMQAMMSLAAAATNVPEKYEGMMKSAAEVNPAVYFTLADYFSDRGDEDKSAQYVEKGRANVPDAILIASYASQMVSYYLKKGRTEDARSFADYGGKVFSFAGLQAKAEFFEATKDYDNAFNWYEKIEQRYGDAEPVMSFCNRYRTKTGSKKFDLALQSPSGRIFPQGIEKVSLGDFTNAPADGVSLDGDSVLMQAAGLKKGNVIVAIYGTRVHNVQQYEFRRDNSTNAELVLIVWKDAGYRQVKASPPHHLFGVDISDFGRQ